MIDDPSGSTSLAQRIRRLPISTFLIVLVIHVSIGAWILSAHFGSSSSAEDSAIFVTLEGAGSEEPGQEESGESQAETLVPVQTPNRAPAQSTSVTTPTPDSPSAKSETASKIVSQDSTTATQQVNTSERSKAISAVSISTSSQTSTASSTNSSSNVASQAQGPTSGASAAAAGPRFVSHIDYLGSPPSPIYPNRAKSRRQEGRVVVRVHVDATGQLRSLSLLKSSGVDALDQSALEAVGQTRFKPYSENGVPLDRLADIPIDFVLN